MPEKDGEVIAASEGFAGSTAPLLCEAEVDTKREGAEKGGGGGAKGTVGRAVGEDEGGKKDETGEGAGEFAEKDSVGGVGFL